MISDMLNGLTAEEAVGFDAGRENVAALTCFSAYQMVPIR